MPLEQGALLGASPELLLRQDGGRFYSNPLAGSARREADPERDREVGERLMARRKIATSIASLPKACVTCWPAAAAT